MELLHSRKAAEFARRAHEGQFRRDGKPYFSHVAAVAQIVATNYDDLIPAQAKHVWLPLKDHIIAAAYLHDVIEDCNVTKEDLLNGGFSQLTVELVQSLSKAPGENYFDFIMRLRVDINWPGAVIIKLADLEHNMSDNPREGSALDKYRFANYILRKRLTP